MKHFYKILVICITFSFLCQSSSAKGGPFYQIIYGEKPPTLTYGTKNEVNINPTLKDFLKKNKSPRVVARFIIPEDIKTKNFDEAYYDYIEEELSKAGFQVVDHKLLAQLENASGIIDYSLIKKKLNIDLIVEVSWLEFGKSKAEVTDFDPQKMILRYCKKPKAEWENVGYIIWDGEPLPLINCTISALFKIVMTSSSTIGGTIRTCAFRDGKTKITIKASTNRETFTLKAQWPPQDYGWNNFSSYFCDELRYYEVCDLKYDLYKPLTSLFCQELASFRK